MRTSHDQYKFTADGPIVYVPQTVEPPENAFLWNGYDYEKQEWIFEGKKDTRTLEELRATIGKN